MTDTERAIIREAMVAHDRACTLADQDPKEAAQLAEQAADLVARITLEPTRSVVHRSAATLAYRVGEHTKARGLIERGLAGNPPGDIEYELYDLLDRLPIVRGRAWRTQFGSGRDLLRPAA